MSANCISIIVAAEWHEAKALPGTVLRKRTFLQADAR
jgi:hypothetical protein